MTAHIYVGKCDTDLRALYQLHLFSFNCQGHTYVSHIYNDKQANRQQMLLVNIVADFSLVCIEVS